MSAAELQAFNDSFERCMDNDQFLDLFYNIFLASSAEVREKFKDTNMKRQTHMMIISLCRMMSSYNRPEALKKIAISHSAANLDIAPHLYDIWLHALISAAEQVDPEFNLLAKSGWKKVMQQGINYIRGHYDKID